MAPLQRFALIVCLLVFAATARAQVSLRNNASLVFGSIIPVNTAGSVTVSSTATRTVSGVFAVFGAGFSPASFTVTIPTGSPQFSVVLPGSMTLSDGRGHSMIVDRFESTPTSGKVSRPQGTASVTVGATLHVGASQPAGPYSGTFQITVANP